MRGAIPPLPIRLHSVVLNKAQWQLYLWRWDRSVTIKDRSVTSHSDWATCSTTGIQFPIGTRIFSRSNIQTGSGINQPLIKYVSAALSREVMGQVRQAERSPLSGAEDKNA